MVPFADDASGTPRVRENPGTASFGFQGVQLQRCLFSMPSVLLRPYSPPRHSAVPHRKKRGSLCSSAHWTLTPLLLRCSYHQRGRSGDERNLSGGAQQIYLPRSPNTGDFACPEEESTELQLILHVQGETEAAGWLPVSSVVRKNQCRAEAARLAHR